MTARGRATALSIALVALLALAPPAGAARELESASILFKYRRASLAKIVGDVARATGERIVFDPALPGHFTALVPRQVTPSEALALLEAVLLSEGYALMRGSADEYRVLRLTDANMESRWGSEDLDPEGQGLVTTMIDVQTADANGVLSSIAHLVHNQDRVLSYPPSNSLIMTGVEKRLQRVIELVQALDRGGLPELWIRTLRHRSALEVSEMMRVAFDPVPGAPEPTASESLEIWADARTNSLLLQGSAERLDRAREFIETVDVDEPAHGRIRVVRILHRDAEEISQRLSDLHLEEMDAAAPPYTIAFDAATNSLLIDAEAEILEAILGVIEELDRPQPRVQVDVIAFEVSHPVNMSLGFDWLALPFAEASGSNSRSLTIGSDPTGGGLRQELGPDISFLGRITRDPLVLTVEDENGVPVPVVLGRESAVIEANDRRVYARTLMRPRLAMVSGEEQEIFVGQNIPIPVSSGTGLSASQTSSRVERQDVGITLSVTPKLGERGKIELSIGIEVSRPTISEAGSENLVGTTLNKRSIDTTIQLADGGMAVLGLSQEGTRNRSEAGTPFLKDLPVLGWLSRATSQRANDVHLVFAVQARALRSQSEWVAESIRQRLALERSQSRMSGLERTEGAPYGILIATRGDPEDAAAIAASFEREGLEAQVGRWAERGRARFDVYLTGYRSLALAGEDTLVLRERGWAPQVVVLPGETALATAPPLRFLGSPPGVSAQP